MAASRKVISNQSGVHDNLAATVHKHLSTRFARPIPAHTRWNFSELDTEVRDLARPLILDAGCGTGDSTRNLAAQFPDHLVIGIDKSAHRLTRERDAALPDNLILMRADLTDFYRLAAELDWRLDRHYILFPNPWPKAAHLQRRWHGSPVFPDLLRLGGRLEVRTNWRIYAEEFAEAVKIAGHHAYAEKYDPQGEYLSLFEKKYAESGHDLWRVVLKSAVS